MSCSTIHKPTLWTTYHQISWSYRIESKIKIELDVAIVQQVKNTLWSICTSTLPTHLVSKLFIQLRCDSFAKINFKMPRFYLDGIFHFSEDKHAAELKHQCRQAFFGIVSLVWKLEPSFIRASGSCFGYYTGFYGTSAFCLDGRKNVSRLAQYCDQRGTSTRVFPRTLLTHPRLVSVRWQRCAHSLGSRKCQNSL